MDRFLLDTQTFVLLSRADTYQTIGSSAKRVLEAEESTLFLSAVSVVELAVETTRVIRRLRFSLHQIDAMLERFDITRLPFTHAAALELYKMPLHHKDPFERMLIATALTTGMPILGSDRQFQYYTGLTVIWA